MINNLYYVLVLLSTALFFIGLVLLLKKPFFNLATSSVKQLDIILDNSIEEKEKDKRILRNLNTLLKHLLLNIILIFLLLICAIFPVLIYSKYKLNVLAETSSIYFYLAMIFGSFSLLLFRNKTDYSYWSKLLHTIILDNYNLSKYLFEREIKGFNECNILSTKKPYVIVTGLARAGTTALTNRLFDKNIFHSISYANVPFLLAPNSWKRIYNPKSKKKKVRAHGDQVLVSENSIEALEEYFFKVFLNDNYIDKSSLKLHNITQELLIKYYMYQDLFREKKTTYYLAKNNNFLLRYESIMEYDQQFKLILIFRSPLEQARSLLRQHENFLAKQNEDKFVLNYMNWLGHHEFGNNQKQFSFENENKVYLDKYDKSELSYWLCVWLNYYTYVIKLLENDNIILVHFDDFIKNPDKLMKAIEVSLEIDLTRNSFSHFIPKKYVQGGTNTVDNNLLLKANKIYANLILKKIELN